MRSPVEICLDYVKTNEKPYDELVVAVLVSFKHHFPAAALSSDGGERDWARGIALYQRATGRQAPGFGVLTVRGGLHGRGPNRDQPSAGRVKDQPLSLRRLLLNRRCNCLRQKVAQS